MFFSTRKPTPKKKYDKSPRNLVTSGSISIRPESGGDQFVGLQKVKNFLKSRGHVPVG